jgi:hypothetical protein
VAEQGEEHMSKEAMTRFDMDMDGSMEPSEYGQWVRYEDVQPKQEQRSDSEHTGEPVAWMDIDEKGAASGLRYWSEPNNRHEAPLYTTPQPAPQRSEDTTQKKPLTDDIWILTSEYNDYDQHGEYFEAVFIGKPTAEQIEKHCGVNEVGSTHILAGGGRVEEEYHWYNLRKEKPPTT